MARKKDITVSARMFHAAMVCVSTEDVRYYINGVHIEPHPDKGAVLVATDGHRMLVCHDEDARCDRSVIVRVQGKEGRALSEALARASRAEDVRLTVDEAGVVTVPGGFRATENTLIDGTFPEWPKVVRPIRAGLRTKAVAHAAFNPRYMASFARVAERLDPADGSPSIRIVSTDEGTAALVLFGGQPAVFGLLMPMRVEVGTALPAFMRPILSALPRERKPKAETPARKGKR